MVTGDVVQSLRTRLSFHNGLVGYVYLVDEEGLIRWQAHAEPAQSELDAMVTCTEQLLCGDPPATVKKKENRDKKGANT